MKITQENIRKFFSYNPETGEFIRIGRINPKTGEFVDCYRELKSKSSHGYLQVSFGGMPRFVHRLIFVYMLGKLPEFDVDHINGDRTDNRWVNLRLVTRKENLRNAGVRNDNTSGYLGVCYFKGRDKWRSYINNNGKQHHLGYYDNIEDAKKARKRAEKDFGFHPNHGDRNGWGN